MNKAILLCGLTLALAPLAEAGIYYNGTGGVIPDGLSSLTQTITSTDVGIIGSVSVVFNISGGLNGDLIAYLAYNDGSSTMTQILLNHITGGSRGFGTGAATTGFASLQANGVTLMDGGVNGNIHSANPGSGNPVAVGNYTPDSTVTFSSTFANMNASGTWTLFFADTVTGDQSTLVSWGLDITPVPEPVNVALGIFGGCLAITVLLRANFAKWSFIFHAR
jgi:hypothetical protein